MRKGEDDSLLGEEEDLSAFKGSQRTAHITAAETHRNTHQFTRVRKMTVGKELWPC